ncbi:single-stranded-DNA-specific exonuclease RecJ [Candidatus Saccharibacteria bacterium]|nr:single-stranded-DNA-specific exonuclease RecJ [Candidatus Saccharibacteria bacterium]
MNKLFAQLLEKRHLKEDFLHPKYEDLAAPFLLPDMDKATKRIKQAIDSQEKILIYGDYDVDGVTASALMEQALNLAGAKNIDIMLPDRFTDGYGMSPRLIEHAKKTNISLVVTVDCGSHNHEVIDELNTLGIDTIVTDHHECANTIPEAIAVVNPKRQDCTGPAALRSLAGVGVAFKLAQALVEQKTIPAGQEKWFLDLVLIGTICDNMPLTGENRILGYYGVKVLEKTRRPGLRELMRSAGVKHITSESIGFQIGPRLNAAGRLDTAELSLQLLRTSSATNAATLSNKLEELNKKRRIEQRIATEEIIKRKKQTDPVIIETGNWHEGILGIVAGHLVEYYHKPAFVLTEIENGIFKGSGRSFGGFNLAEALNYAKDSIINGGGHAGAAGVKVEQKNLYAFREKINEYYRSLHLADQEIYFKTSADLTTENLKDLSLDFIEELKLLEPFGVGNEEPIICIKNPEILEIKHIGDQGQHIRIDIKGKDGKILKCIAFSAPEAWFNLDSYEPHDYMVKPIENEWNGVRTVEARLIDITNT